MQRESPLMAKKRTKNHKFIKVKNMRNIISLCSDIKLYDQNILEHDLQNILLSTISILQAAKTKTTSYMSSPTI